MVNTRQVSTFVIALVLIGSTPTPCHAQGGKNPLSAILKFSAGGAAAYSASKARHSSEVFHNARRSVANATADVARAKAKEVEFESQVLSRLRDQGLDASQAAIYSVYLTLNNDASAVYWADTFNKSDVFFCLDLEGQGSFLVPQIRYEYTGGPVLDRIIAREVRPGSKIVVRVLDDDSWSNEVWKSVLQTRVNFDVTGGLVATKLASVRASATGQLQLLSDNSQVTLDPPDEIATIFATVPQSEDGKWFAKGELRDGNNREVGTIEIACVWSAQGERAAFESWVAAERARLAFERAGLEVKESVNTERAASAGASFWFWSVAGGLAALWFIVSIVRRDSVPEPPLARSAELGAAESCSQ